jgi:carbonic anhydrase
MPILRTTCLAAALAAISLASACAEMKGGHDWSYEGRHGPLHWANAENACGGHRQSPIDLTGAIKADVVDIVPFWSVFRPEVVNNGHTIQANASPNNTTTFGDEKYKLLQVHWHHESEHTVEGQHAPLEAHFVHKNMKTGELMVLGVMMVPGEHNADLQKVWEVAPYEPGKAMAKSLVNWYALLPSDHAAYRYYGSLTTPPCTEIVNWVVFQQPVRVSPMQIAEFTQWFPHNNRPVQPRGRRFLLKGN